MHIQQGRMFLKRHKGNFVAAFFLSLNQLQLAIGSPRSAPVSHILGKQISGQASWKAPQSQLAGDSPSITWLLIMVYYSALA
jgi:hypothetical protein